MEKGCFETMAVVLKHPLQFSEQKVRDG